MNLCAKYSFIVVISICLDHCNGQAVNITRMYLDRTLNALERALAFFDREHNTVNVDGLMTTRAMQGQLRVLYRRIIGAPNLWNVEPHILNRIRELSVYAGVVTERGVPYRMTFNPEYYQIYSAPIRRGFWELEYGSRDLPRTNRIYPYREDQAVPAYTSNFCMGEIMGTTGRPPCDISSSCWRSMTDTGYYGYSLSHNVLFLIWGQMSGCDAEMERMRLIQGQRTIDEQNTEFCANMMAESVHIRNRGYIWAGQDGRDLFMEDAFFCGILGFRQFFRFDWLEDILSWQHPTHGCYSFERNFPRQVNGQRRLVRKKRSEVVLRYGCLSHLTGMALGSLTQYVRYLLENLASLTNGVTI